MKYIFIDTNNYIYSAVSSQEEHKIESYEKIKEVIKKKEAVLLLPEITEIEFYRRINEVYIRIENYFDTLKETIKKSELPPFLAGDKQRLLMAFKDILKEKEKRYKNILKETEELFFMEGNKRVSINADIFIRAYLRCLKGEKPFKVIDDRKLGSGDEFFKNISWLSDCLAAESIIRECSSMDKQKDVLVFCSNNTKDFADFDEKTKKHLLHRDIKKDIRIETAYYKFIPEMLGCEFKKPISKGGKQATKDTQRYYEKVGETTFLGGLAEAAKLTMPLSELLKSSSYASGLGEAAKLMMPLSELLKSSSYASGLGEAAKLTMPLSELLKSSSYASGLAEATKLMMPLSELLKTAGPFGSTKKVVEKSDKAKESENGITKEENDIEKKGGKEEQ